MASTTTLFVLLYFIALDLWQSAAENHELNHTVESVDGHQSRILSRRKRFLTFPDGSSFQLVFCTQSHGYLQIGDVVWLGNTAALAWELPSDPALFKMFKHFDKGDPGLRRQDTKQVVYLNEDGKIISTVPYPRKKILVNPAFAKRSVDELPPSRNVAKTFSVKELHETNTNRGYLQDLDGNSVEYHRESRKSLYAKLEKLFEALGWQGKECILRLLCENGKRKPQQKQGSFMDEIMRATFTLPSNTNTTSELPEYDAAYRSEGGCSELYPQCRDLEGRYLFKAHS